MRWRKNPDRGKRIEPTLGGGAAPEVVAERRAAGRASKPAPKRKARSKQKRGPWPWRLFVWSLKKTPRMAYWGAVFALWGFIVALAVFGWYGAKLPNAANWELPERAPNVKIVSDDGGLILNRGVGGDRLPIDQMSPWLPQAVIAIEDHRFQYHFGFDPIGFTRAMVRNVASGRMREGGSTITQQLAKNLFLKPERTIERKIQELIIALWLEAKYSKREILEIYLNRVYFGAGAYGVDAAARRYFGKSAQVVNLQEAAMLAGLLKAPSRYSPARNLDLAQARSKLVLQAMQREGFIEASEVKPDGTPVITTQTYRSGPEHFVADMVTKRAQALLGEIKSDVVVETTISPFLMTVAQQELTKALEKDGQKRRVSQAALVTLAPDGGIKALIGGMNYGESQYNRAVDAKRQPGSTFKTFVWQAALEGGYVPASLVTDEPIRIGKWRPANYDGKYRGDVRLDEAFAQSLNTVAVRLIRETGAGSVADTAARMGITSKLSRNASLALGTSEVSLLDLTNAYVPFANGGVSAEPYLIERISTPEGKVLYQRGKRPRERVVSSAVVGAMNGMLSKVVTEGTGKRAAVRGHHIGGKTGTSQNFRDAWFVGVSAHYVTGVWMGNDDNAPTRKLTGGNLPAQVFGNYMTTALQGLPAKVLPGDGYLLATLPAQLPVPTARPWQPGEPRPRVYPGRDETVVSTVPRKRTILDILFGD